MSAAFVVLLRGVNVGRTRSLPMATFRSSLASIGCTSVSTYIQSGNAVVRWSGREDELVAAGTAAVSEEAGFDIGVVARHRDEWHELARSPIFAEVTDGTRRVVTLLDRAPEPDALAPFDLDAAAPERVALCGRDVIFSLPHGQARAVLPTMLAPAFTDRVATTRNWNTISKLDELAERTHKQQR